MSGPDVQPTAPAEVVGYDDSWPRAFRQIAAEVHRLLDGFDHEVLHVGSTSVPGLVAKPIIDVLAVVGDSEAVPGAITALRAGGWLHQGDGGLAGRECFTVRPELPYQHLYLVVRGSDQHLLPTRLRDILRADPAAREAYAAVKIRLAPLLATDRRAYTEGKTDVINSLLERSGS